MSRFQMIADRQDLIRRLVADKSCDFDTSTYDDVWLALYRLHHMDASKLSGSDVLAALYSAGKMIATAVDAELAVIEDHSRAWDVTLNVRDEARDGT